MLLSGWRCSWLQLNVAKNDGSLAKNAVGNRKKWREHKTSWLPCCFQTFGEKHGVYKSLSLVSTEYRFFMFSQEQGRDFWWLAKDGVSISTKCWSGLEEPAVDTHHVLWRVTPQARRPPFGRSLSSVSLLITSQSLKLKFINHTQRKANKLRSWYWFELTGWRSRRIGYSTFHHIFLSYVPRRTLIHPHCLEAYLAPSSPPLPSPLPCPALPYPSSRPSTNVWLLDISPISLSTPRVL